MRSSDVVLFIGAGFSNRFGLPINLFEAVLKYLAENDAETEQRIKYVLPDRTANTNGHLETLLSIIQRLQRQHQAGRPALKGIPDPDDFWNRIVAAVAEVTYFQHEGREDWIETLKPLTEFFEKVPVSVITTNYDLILDKSALEATGRRSLADLPRYQYGYPVRNLYPRRDPCTSWSCNEIVTPIYKLHGSLNWAYCEYCNALDLAAEKGDLKALQHPVQRPTCYVCEAPYKPTLIPPVPNKDASNPLLAQVWRKAEQALERASLVIFVGYSLPFADPRVAEMVATARLRSEQARDERWKFCVIDPSCSTHDRYRNVLGSPGRHHMSKFDFELLWDSWQSGGEPFIG